VIDILFRDRAILVCVKPANLLSVPGRGSDDNLIDLLRIETPDLLTVHRLDCETSGITVLARDKSSQAALSRQFQERIPEKRYLAVGNGIVDEDAGVIEVPLSPDWVDRPRQRVDYLFGKDAETRWQVLARGPDTTTFALTPVTGRTHQLRVHLAALGHPILGDSLYAPAAVKARADRLLLHAQRLAFRHPTSDRWLQFEQAPDPVWTDVVNSHPASDLFPPEPMTG